MKDSIEIYASIRKWEELRLKFIENMKKKQSSLDEDSIISDESEIILRNEMKEIEIAFLNESTDVEYIVTQTFPELKKGAWINNFYIEENKIEQNGYEYNLFEEKNASGHPRKNYKTLEDVVGDVLKFSNSKLTIEEAIKKFYF